VSRGPPCPTLCKTSWALLQAANGKLPPIEAEVDEKKRRQGKGDDADGREAVAQMAPVPGPEVEHSAGNECKCDGIGASHPLAVLDDVAIARSEEGSRGADDPGGSLHRCSRKAGTAAGERNSGCGADKDGEDVDASEEAMKLEVLLSDPRGEIDWTDQESEHSSECMWDEEMAVGNHLQTVGVVHRIVGNEEQLGGNKDKERGEAQRDPKNHLESGTSGSWRK